MASKAIIAIAAVVILAAGGVGVYMLAGNGGDDSGSKDIEDFDGLVYGNANGDCVLDADDLALINKIIDGDESLDDYPLADANMDGEVNSSDVEIVNKIIAGESTTIYVSDTENTVAVSYPMTKIFAAGGTNMRVLIQVLDMEPELVACATTSYYSEAMDYSLYHLLKDEGLLEVSTAATNDDFKKLNQVKTEKGLNVAVLESRNVSGYNEDSARDIFAEWNVSVLNMECESIFELRQSLATLGIAMNQQANAVKMIDVLDSTLQAVKDKAVEKYGTPTVMCITMSNSVSGTTSDYFKMTELAGGDNLADWEDKTRVFAKGDTWLYESKYNPDYLFHFKSITYGQEVSDKDLDAYRGYFSETAAYKAGHYFLINGVVPMHVRLAWMAQIMFADEIESNWSDTLFQEYLDTFGDVNNGKTAGSEDYFDVTKHAYHWTV